MTWLDRERKLRGGPPRERTSRFWHVGRVHFGWSRSWPTDTLNLVVHVSQKNPDTYPMNARTRFEFELKFTSNNPPNRRPQ